MLNRFTYILNQGFRENYLEILQNCVQQKKVELQIILT